MGLFTHMQGDVAVDVAQLPTSSFSCSITLALPAQCAMRRLSAFPPLPPLPPPPGRSVGTDASGLVTVCEALACWEACSAVPSCCHMQRYQLDTCCGEPPMLLATEVRAYSKWKSMQ